MQPDFLRNSDISPESVEKLEIYYELLLKWQLAINLVSPATIENAWERHFADSAQLVDFIPEHVRVICDLGSGAGFPGMVLAILCPDLDIHLIESDGRKCEFLKTVSRETETPVKIHNTRIEDIWGTLNPDFITARALAPLEDLLGLCAPCLQQNSAAEMLFLKGEKAEEEVEKARKNYDFVLKTHYSQTNKKGRILHVSALLECA